MILKYKLLFNISKLILVLFFVAGCSKEQQIPQKKLTIGKYYLFFFYWENENPFELKRIDTVKVIGIKNGYVQWQYKNGVKQSCSVSIFKDLIRYE